MKFINASFAIFFAAVLITLSAISTNAQPQEEPNTVLTAMRYQARGICFSCMKGDKPSGGNDGGHELPPLPATNNRPQARPAGQPNLNNAPLPADPLQRGNSFDSGIQQEIQPNNRPNTPESGYHSGRR